MHLFVCIKQSKYSVVFVCWSAACIVGGKFHLSNTQSIKGNYRLPRGEKTRVFLLMLFECFFNCSCFVNLHARLNSDKLAGNEESGEVRRVGRTSDKIGVFSYTYSRKNPSIAILGKVKKFSLIPRQPDVMLWAVKSSLMSWTYIVKGIRVMRECVLAVRYRSDSTDATPLYITEASGRGVLATPYV